MSASDALTIWILRTAINAPSVEPITAIHIFAAVGTVVWTGRVSALDEMEAERTCAVMAVLPRCVRGTVPDERPGDNHAKRENTIPSERLIGRRSGLRWPAGQRGTPSVLQGRWLWYPR